MATWVDLGDLYTKKAGDTVSGNIIMSNNNLSVVNGDNTYNVGTEIKSLWDSVSSVETSVSKIVAGSTIKSLSKADSTHSVTIFTAAELKAIIGTDWTQQMIMVCSNGDAAAQNNIYSIVCTWNNVNKEMNVMCHVSTASSGNMRLNYICYLTA